MSKFYLIAAAAVLALAVPAKAAEPAAARGDYSTVRLALVAPVADYSNGHPLETKVNTNGVILPVSAARPVSIFIDDDFVGHAMFGMVQLKPTFNLPSGVHKFRIECDGFQSVHAEMKVLSGGCEQWLVVKLQNESNTAPDAVKNPAAAAGQ